MKRTLGYVICLLLGLQTEARPQQSNALPSTEQFMNVIAACGAGSSFSREGNFQSTAKNIYEAERTQGKSIVDILTNIIDKLPQDQRLEAYKLYIDCVKSAISGQLAPAPPEKQKGWLQYANEPTPPNGCDGSGISPDRTLLILGDTGYAFDTSHPPGKSTAVQIGACSLLSIGVGDNGAIIDADIYSVAGELIGSIRDNGWEVSNTRHLTIEKMGDLSGIVVHDENGVELLYVRYFSHDTFKVRGIFTCPSPRLDTITITDKAIVYPRNMITFSNGCISGARVGFLFR
jgi:hypothetical protein